MQLDPVENNFRADKPWRTLLNLYRPERRWVFAAMISYLFKACPLWILPVITANLTDIIAHRSAGGLRSLWINVAVGTVAIVQNIPSAMLYVDFLSRSVRNVEIHARQSHHGVSPSDQRKNFSRRRGHERN
jgi:ATP-binding cassette subfamily B protein